MAESSNLGAFLAALITSAVLYLVGNAAYLLFFSPISHIPGPKLAAVTYFYQSYFDLYPYQGRWLFQQIELHKRYGPVVRVGPDEIHIQDPNFYTEFAGTSTKKRDKSTTWYWFAGMKLNIGSAAFATLDHSHHALRRGAMNPFFSKKKVQELEGRVREHVQKMTNRLLKCGTTGEIINLLYLTSALTMDVITDYSFGKSTSALDTPDLGRQVRQQLESGVQIHPFGRQFRTFVRFMMDFVSFGSRHLGLFKEFSDFNDMIYNLTDPAYKKAMEEGDDGKGAIETSIVHSMVHNNTLPPEEKTRDRIESEAGNLFGAGTETTARTLAVGLFYVLNDPAIHTRLLAELRTIMSTAESDLPTVFELSRLPYLTACIHESTRMAHGVAGRLVRISPDDDLISNGVVIPRGTTFSMSHYIQHTDPKIFPDPFVFKPDRYMGDKAAETLRYLVPFGKGPRMCLGMNLAWSEMYLSFASLIRGIDMELFETTVEDVTITREYFLGLFPKESRGIRVKVNGVQA